MVNVFAVTVVGLVTMLFLIVRDQLKYRKVKGGLPGPSWVPPFIGNIIAMVVNPVDFYNWMAMQGKFCANSLIGMFMLYITDTQASRKVFFSGDKYSLFLVPNAKPILGDEHNMAFMTGEPHRLLRKRLLPLFSKRALDTYLGIQDRVIREHVNSWFSLQPGTKLQPLARDLTVASSQTVFIGPYITDAAYRHKLSELYKRVTRGMLTFPVNLPGTALWSAVQARKQLIRELCKVAERSKTAMRSGQQPACLLDFWMEAELQAEERGETAYDFEAVAYHVLDFLFASQDASTSSLVWAVELLHQYPDVLRRVREEQRAVRPHHEPVTHDMLDKLVYTQQVMREILRFRPPVSTVPHVSEQPITDLVAGQTFPKGSIFWPDIISVAHQGYPNANSFDPDRFSVERQEHIKYADQFLVFGAGPHLCLGRQYAMNQLSLFVSILAEVAQWDRVETPRMHMTKFMPTVVPDDDCPVTFRRLHAA